MKSFKQMVEVNHPLGILFRSINRLLKKILKGSSIIEKDLNFENPYIQFEYVKWLSLTSNDKNRNKLTII
jgi:hypothetical protein